MKGTNFFGVSGLISFSFRYSSMAESMILGLRLSVAAPTKVRISSFGRLLRLSHWETAVLFSVIVPVLSSSNKFKFAASWIPVKSDVNTPSLLRRVASKELDKANVDGIATGIEAINIMAKNGSISMTFCPRINAAITKIKVNTPSKRQR